MELISEPKKPQRRGQDLGREVILVGGGDIPREVHLHLTHLGHGQGQFTTRSNSRALL